MIYALFFCYVSVGIRAPCYFTEGPYETAAACSEERYRMTKGDPKWEAMYRCLARRVETWQPAGG